MKSQCLLASLGFLCFARAHPFALTGSNSTTLNWGKCPDEYNGTWPSSISCAELVVPMDWGNSLGPTITIMMNKAPATNSQKRIGSLILNPGGPGGSGMEFVANGVSGTGLSFSDELREHFDLIGPDPRGIGYSTPMRCNPDLWNKRVTIQPKNESEYESVLAYWRELGEDCKARTGPAFDHFNTDNTARDLEAIRIALGEGPINYFGMSYGTALGSRYLELFPGNIRTLLLDAVCDSALNETSFSSTELQSYEVVVDHFAAWAGANESSPLHGRDVGALLDDLFTRADKTPVKAPGCHQDNSTALQCRPDVTGEEMRFNLQLLLLYPIQYPTTAQAVLEAANGNATQLSTEWYVQDRNVVFSEKGVACKDWPSSSTWAEWQLKTYLLKSISPHLQGINWDTGIQMSCQAWPTTPTGNPHNIQVSSASAPVLLVNSLYDTETPYSWAVNQQRGIDGSVLLTRDGDGHSSYVLFGDTQKAMDAYLVNVTVPEPGTVYSS
ncbi:Alpha/beta hydrolase fold-1 [Niveomyces insectorum RCEF 264]|uniref:Alpha/beta hydrolase fold-1 n=1 Tax=Niveomyces insectorum RCEF 264 TaxID=1081102 RepID=A0A167SKN7_9HYPO|nr:Alpha/beta hydrolase fold-1 [Niveomyces insectorum RCEF 264]